jgi:hypothetical protein
MDSMVFILVIVVTVLTVGGVWGSVILSGLMKRRAMKLEAGPDDPRIEQLQEGYGLLEARLEQLEEEVSFFRELHRPDSPPQLGSPGDE